MRLLGIDIGSSSVKCALVQNDRLVGKIVHAKYASNVSGPRVEVQPNVLLKAVQTAVAEVGPQRRKVDAVALSVFSPGWLAMDRKGKPLTPIVTHADRRSVDVARELENRVGEDRYYKIAGVRPFPGGISSSTWAWFVKNEPGRLRRADLVGHLNTFLHRQFTGARVIDPANACFMGLYATHNLSGWDDELCKAVGASRTVLPEVKEANAVGGKLTAEAARQLGLTAGTLMTVGVVDGSAAMLSTGAAIGQLLNVCGSTDVLALCTDRFHPHPRLLTRPLGIGKVWLSVSTLAAAGSAVSWIKDQLYGELDWPAFLRRALSLSGSKLKAPKRKRTAQASDDIHFEPYLAGDRMSIDQKQAAISGLTLASTRDDILRAMLDALAKASAERLELLQRPGANIKPTVVITGGAGRLTDVFHRDWPGRWRFKAVEEATLRGLARLEPVGG